MFTTLLTTVLAFSASAFAFTTPTTFNDTSNPIYTPNNGHIVPVGKPYQITWGPTESGTVSIMLLRGPSTNILPLYPIVEKIPNTGAYTWTPKADLEPDTTHYGIQIVIDSNGQYQYSTQFGISNPDYVPSSSSSTSSAATTAAPTTTGSYKPEETTTSYETVYTTTKSSVTSFITVTTSSAPYEQPSTTSVYVAPSHTYTPPSNGTVSYTPTATVKPAISSSLPPVPEQTGAASSVKVASGLFMGIAGVAAMLL